MGANQRGLRRAVRATASDSEQRGGYAPGERSMTSSIFVRAVAFSACGTLAGMYTTVPGVSSAEDR